MGSTSYLLGFVIWYLFVEANATNRALIFNKEREALIALPNNLPKVNCENWVTVCPADDNDERNFNETYSVYNKALFLRSVYHPNTKCTEFNEAVCDNPIETSMTLSADNKKYEFGYEIFHENKQFSNISHFPFHYFYPMKKFEAKSSMLAFFNSFKSAFKEMRARQKVEPTLFLRTSKMEFLWIPLVRVKLHLIYFRNVEYEIRKNNINPMLPCQDYSLGNEMWDSKVVDSLFSKETQREIFEEVKLTISTSDTDDKVPEGACNSEYECLTKWPLLPTDQFQFPSDSPVKCSHLTTIPIWKSTLEKIMKKLDNYLYTLQRISGQPLRVLAGVHQELELEKRKRRTDKNVSLKLKKTKIETPKIIFKLVKFKLNPCEENKNCWYGILIVIHNGPYIVKKDLICEDQSGDLGWEEIRYETWTYSGARSKFIYVCEISKETMKSVGLTYAKDTKFVPLSLLKFPVFDKDKKLVFDSIKEKVFHELKRVIESGKEVELDDGIIERPSLNDNFGSVDGDDIVYEDELEQIENSGTDSEKEETNSEKEETDSEKEETDSEKEPHLEK